MRRILLIGDAGCDSGFARNLHKLLESCPSDIEPVVLGLNYDGDSKVARKYPYDIWRANKFYGDGFGLKRIPEILSTYASFDLFVVQNDPWNFPAYLKVLGNFPTLGIVAVDGLNCAGAGLNPLRRAVFWTDFGAAQAKQGGYTGQHGVVGLGVDLDIYRAHPRVDARKQLAMPPVLHDAFIVGNVNRNQPRKRLDLTIRYFARWIKEYKIKDAYLYLHVAPTGDQGIDCRQLARYYGIGGRIMVIEPNVYRGLKEGDMALTYSTFDVQVSTTQGEGWGLTQLEGMACGVPQIFPDWAALGEWPADAAMKVPCTSTCTTFNSINVIGGIPDEEYFVECLNDLYKDRELRESYSQRSLAKAREEQFDWKVIGQKFFAEVETALAEPFEIKKPVEVLV